MKKFLKVLVLLPCLVFLVNCSKSSDKKASTNNNCYNQNGSNTYYQQNCNNQNGGYYMSGNQCYSQTGQIVPITNCQNGGGSGGMCDGIYWYQGQQVCCGQTCVQQYGFYGNCSGYTLINQSGQTVRCQ